MILALVFARHLLSITLTSQQTQCQQLLAERKLVNYPTVHAIRKNWRRAPEIIHVQFPPTALCWQPKQTPVAKAAGH
jgi:hypothetical protein